MKPHVFVSVLFLTLSSLAIAADVPDSADDVKPLLPGMSAPAFTAIRASGEEFDFDPEQMTQPAVIMFYRGGWCPYCNAYLAKMRLAEEELCELGYEILFLSADRQKKLAKTAKKEKLDYTLLSDASMEIAGAFGVAFRVDDDTVKRLRRFGHNIEKASGHTHHILPVPSAFIVGTDGVIRFQYVNPDYKVRLDPELLLTAARLAAAESS